MANTKQAKKRAGQSLVRRGMNRAVISQTKKALKTFRAAIPADPAKAGELLPETSSVLDVAARKGVIHVNTANRLKSRAAKAVRKATAATAAAAAAK
jgi:small subunit ribosomal protein S20